MSDSTSNSINDYTLTTNGNVNINLNKGLTTAGDTTSIVTYDPSWNGTISIDRAYNGYVSTSNGICDKPVMCTNEDWEKLCSEFGLSLEKPQNNSLSLNLYVSNNNNCKYAYLELDQVKLCICNNDNRRIDIPEVLFTISFVDNMTGMNVTSGIDRTKCYSIKSARETLGKLKTRYNKVQALVKEMNVDNMF